jgi:hypothetical protein
MKNEDYGENAIGRNLDGNVVWFDEDTCFAQTMGFTRGVQRKQNTVSSECFIKTISLSVEILLSSFPI